MGRKYLDLTGLNTLWEKIKAKFADIDNAVYYVAGTHDYASWVANKAYVVGDLINYSNTPYSCKTAHTSGSSFDSSKWTRLTTTTWKGSVPGITTLKVGMKIAYKVPIAGGSSSTYLNINDLGNKYVYRNTTNTTTHLPVNTIVFLTYDGTYWKWADYSVSSNSYYAASDFYCSTGASTAAKAATGIEFVYDRHKNIAFRIYFTNANTSQGQLTLNVNGQGAKNLFINGTNSSSSNYTIPIGVYWCYYDGTQWQLWTDKSIWGLNVRGDGSNLTEAFTTASSRANIATGETNATIFGKIAKWFSDLKALAFKDKVNDSDIDGTISNSHIASAATWNAKQDALATQTAYSAKGTATKVPQITTNSLGQVTGITEVTISGVTPASHASTATTYGIGTTSNYGHVKLATGDMNGQANVDGVAVSKNHTHSQYLPKAGGTMTGGITLPPNFYHEDSKFGIDAKNSDIINANSIYFGDEATSSGEGIHFKRGDSGNTDNYDSFWIDNGKICFSPNHAVSTDTPSYSAQIVPRLPNSVSNNQVVLTNGTTGALKTLAASSLSVGTATTATTATNYNTSSGNIKTELEGKSSTTHTHSVSINGNTKTIAASGGTAVDLGTYKVFNYARVFATQTYSANTNRYIRLAFNSSTYTGNWEESSMFKLVVHDGLLPKELVFRLWLKGSVSTGVVPADPSDAKLYRVYSENFSTSALDILDVRLFVVEKSAGSITFTIGIFIDRYFLQARWVSYQLYPHSYGTRDRGNTIDNGLSNWTYTNGQDIYEDNVVHDSVFTQTFTVRDLAIRMQSKFTTSAGTENLPIYIPESGVPTPVAQQPKTIGQQTVTYAAINALNAYDAVHSDTAGSTGRVTSLDILADNVYTIPVIVKTGTYAGDVKKSTDTWLNYNSTTHRLTVNIDGIAQSAERAQTLTNAAGSEIQPVFVNSGDYHGVVTPCKSIETIVFVESLNCPNSSSYDTSTDEIYPNSIYMQKRASGTTGFTLNIKRLVLGKVYRIMFADRAESYDLHFCNGNGSNFTVVSKGNGHANVKRWIHESSSGIGDGSYTSFVVRTEQNNIILMYGY